MEFISQLPHYAMQILPFLFVLTVVVFFHELGHFMVARWNGVKVTDFSIGFGKEIFGFNDKHGTRWRFAWIPLGGYVKFVDDDNPASAPDTEAFEKMSPQERDHSFQGKSLGQRSAIVAAGPIANFILAIVVLTGIYTFAGETVSPPRIGGVVVDSVAQKAGFRENDLIKSIDREEITSFQDMQRIVSVSGNTELSFIVERDNKDVVLPVTPIKHKTPDGYNVAMLELQPFIAPRIGAIVAGSAAEKAGFLKNDEIVRIGDTAIVSFNRMAAIVSGSAGKSLNFHIVRDGREMIVPVTPATKLYKTKSGVERKVGRLGVHSPRSSLTKKYNPAAATWKSTKETYFIISNTLSYLGKVIVGRESADQLGGPIRIAQISTQAAEAGGLHLLKLIAILSVSIGLINLFPIPVLDGGHLLFYLFEAIKGEPLSEKTREYGFKIGLALVLMLMVFTFWIDLSHIKIL